MDATIQRTIWVLFEHFALTTTVRKLLSASSRLATLQRLVNNRGKAFSHNFSPPKLVSSEGRIFSYEYVPAKTYVFFIWRVMQFIIEEIARLQTYIKSVLSRQQKAASGHDKLQPDYHSEITL